MFAKDLLVMFNIFSFLNAFDICKHAALVCKKWFLLSTQNYHWSNLAKERYRLTWHLPTNNAKAQFAQIQEEQQYENEIVNIKCTTNWKLYFKERCELELGTNYRLEKMEYLLKRYRSYPNPSFLKELIEWTNRELYKAEDTFFNTWIKMMLASEEENIVAESVLTFVKPNLFMTRYQREDSETGTEISSEARLYFHQIHFVEYTDKKGPYNKQNIKRFDPELYVTVKFDFEQNRARKGETSVVKSEINAELYVDIERASNEYSDRKILFTWQGYEGLDDRLECRERRVEKQEFQWVLERLLPNEMHEEDKLKSKALTEDVLLQFLIVRMGGAPETLLL
jgi:hypothetical protein